MNLYGDLGNVVTLQKRCEWRGIELEIINIQKDTELTKDFDLFFIGGGQDSDQLKVYTDLINNKKEVLTEKIENNTPGLVICGGYQLLGKYFLDSEGNKIEGLGILPIETVAPSGEMADRCVGNIITKVKSSKLLNHYSNLQTIVGFENHSGRTKIENPNHDFPDLEILGDVLIGNGDNINQVSDGLIYKNVIASYCHGSLLPKNPHIADFLIKSAIENKYNHEIELIELDDSAEISAHKKILEKYNVKI